MKKKLMVAVVGVICLLSMVLAGCAGIKIEDAQTDVIDEIRNAINISQDASIYPTYYVREKFNTNPANIAENETVEYLLNWQSKDNTINDETKINFTVNYTKGITTSTDSFIFGNSLPKSVDAKKATKEDYKWHQFLNYKESKNSPAFTRKCDDISADVENSILNFTTPYNDKGGKEIVTLSDYTMANILNNLGSLTKDDIKLAEKNAKIKKGKITTFRFSVIKEGHDYNFTSKDENGKVVPVEIEVKLYTSKNPNTKKTETRVMSVNSVDEKYTMDIMYQGPKIDIPSYDNFNESDNQITLSSDRSDGLVALYTKNDVQGLESIDFEKTINPVEIAEFKVYADKEGNIVDAEDENALTYTYKITTIESAVNWAYEYTEILFRLVAYDEDGNEYELESENQFGDAHYFVQTKNIVKTEKDWSSMIPMAAAVVAVIALLLALMALFKIKKQNKELTKQIKALNGESEDEIVVDAVVEEAEKTEDAVADEAVEGEAKAEEVAETAEKVDEAKAEDETVATTTEEVVEEKPVTEEATNEVVADTTETAEEKPAKKTTKKSKK